MAIVYRELSPESRPDWCAVTSAGTFRVRAGGRFDPHHHDCHEYWLIISGRADITVGGEPARIGPGDIVCTEIGRTHDILAVDDVLVGFWFEAETIPGGTAGHLHNTPEEAAGHPVATLAPEPGMEAAS